MSVKPQGSDRQEQARATRAAILKAARELFTQHGYADTPTDQLCRRAGVTSGALYHHFRDKRAVFAAVYEILRREISSKVMAAGTDESDLWARFRRGCSAYLDACLDPAVQRVVSLESWSVLGREAMSDMNSARGSGMVSKGMIQMGIEEAIDAGFIDEQPSQPLAEIIGGALGAAGIAIARSENKEVARRELGRAVDWLLDRLKNRVEPNRRTSQPRR